MEFPVFKRPKRAVNLIPLVDIVFLLLVFFMLGSNLNQKNIIELNIPDQVGQKNNWKNSLIIRPTENFIWLNALKVTPKNLQNALIEMRKKGSKKAIIKPYKNTPLQTVVYTLDQVKIAGINIVVLAK